MMQSGIGIELPTAETDTAPAEAGVQVAIKADQSIYVGNSVVNINLLERHLLNAFAGKSKKVVYLQADKNLPYGFVMDVLDIVKKTGIELIGLMTQPKEKETRRK
jgi:biopolymer transport protein TolR